jgi:hypothetical protein
MLSAPLLGDGDAREGGTTGIESSGAYHGKRHLRPSRADQRAALACHQELALSANQNTSVVLADLRTKAQGERT